MALPSTSTFIILVVVLITLPGTREVYGQDANLVGGEDSGTADTRDCYFCSTSHGQDGIQGECGYGFDSTKVLQYKNCLGVCTKNVVHDIVTDEVVTINRLCESECPGDNQCTEVAHGKKTCTYCCTGELCNSATVMKLSTLALAIVTIQTIVFVLF